MNLRVKQPDLWVECASGEIDMARINTPVGLLAIQTQGECLLGAEWLFDGLSAKSPKSAFLQGLTVQVAAYWHSPLAGFTVPLLKRGTEFQRKVWQALMTIPCAKTISYAEFASLIDSGARAVGGACRENPFPLFVPCHRVISKTGIHGYAGQMEGRLPLLKRQLLAHEAASGL